MNKYLTTKEAADEIGVSRQWLYIIANRHGIRSVGTFQEKGRKGRRAVWNSADIARLRDAHKRRLELLAQAKSVELEVAP